MNITDTQATKVIVPLEVPLRHANGRHWGRFVRTLVEVKADNGIVGLGEMGAETNQRKPSFVRWRGI
jgi:glucarate dehydratase